MELTTANDPAIGGHVEPGFESVREVFAENFRTRGDTGAEMCAYVGGREVAHLWGGNATDGTRWSPSTVVCGMSTLKPVLASAVGVLADRGVLDLDAPVADFWPEFGVNGKEALTTAHVLTQTAGLATFPGQADIVSLDDPASFARVEEIARALAAAPPQTPPGDYITSHSMTVGWLLGEIVRRASGRAIAEVVRTEVMEPLGVEAWIGLPTAEQGRAADMETDPEYDSDAIHSWANPDTPQGQALCLGPQRRLGTALRLATNDPAYRAAANPAAGGFATARALARVYAMLVGGGELEGTRILSEELVREMTTVRISARDTLFGGANSYSLGFLHESEDITYGVGPNAFGYPGQGGQLAFGDPDAGIGFAYLPRRIVFLQGTDPRAQSLIGAVRAAL